MSDYLDDLRNTYRELAECCLHQPAWSPDDVAVVLAAVWDGDTSAGWERGPKQSTESTAYTVVRLKDGRYGLLADSEDLTGHGCQCDSSALAYGSLDELLRMGIPEAEACALILEAVPAAAGDTPEANGR